MTTVSEDERNAAASPSIAARLDAPVPYTLRTARSSATTPVSRGGSTTGAGTAATDSSATAGETTISRPSKRAAACVRMPDRRNSSSGSRSQPPRPTTIDSSSPTPRAVSSLTRPSRMRTIRSAIVADSGSWLTSTAVHRSERTSSPIVS